MSSCQGRVLNRVGHFPDCLNSRSSFVRPVFSVTQRLESRQRSQSCRPCIHAEVKTFSTSRNQRGVSKSEKLLYTLKDWMHYIARIPNIDTGSMSKVLHSLHIDLPKTMPNYKEFLPNASIFRPMAEQKGKSTNQSAIQSGKEVKHNFKFDGDIGVIDSRNKQIGGIQPSSNDQNDTAFQPKVQEIFSFQKDEQNNNKSGSFVEPNTDLKVKNNLPVRPEETITSRVVDTATNALNMTTNVMKHLGSYFPSMGGLQTSDQGSKTLQIVKVPEQISSESTSKKREKIKIVHQLVARDSIDRKMRGLVLSLRRATSDVSQMIRLEELCRHLTLYPEARSVAIKSKILPCLLKFRAGTDPALRDCSREALALVGYVDPVCNRGVRILCLDGGGTRGLIAIEILKKLEAATNQRVFEMFDYICGVSTGALIGLIQAAFRLTLDETEEIYKRCSSQMFARNKLLGAGKLFMSHAYYDTELWEKLLSENIGSKTFLETARDPLCPKFSVISTLTNVPRVQNFLFRNYNVPAGRQSRYAGSVDYKVWESIRASSAAPGYYEEFQLGDYVHQDGGLLTNNPTAIAIHECNLLWPRDALQCVVSIGTGRYESIQGPEPGSKSSLKAKVTKIIESATDTEAVHTVLHDLLKPSSYFRFNPYMSEEFFLDEIRVEKWDQMQRDTEMYCRKNQLQLELAAQKLLQPKKIHKKAADWINLKLDMIG